MASSLLMELPSHPGTAPLSVTVTCSVAIEAQKLLSSGNQTSLLNKFAKPSHKPSYKETVVDGISF